MFSDLTLLLVALAPACAVLCAVAPAQAKPDPDTQALLARMEAARGKAAQPLATLVVEGRVTAGSPGAGPDEPVGEGTYRELWAGADRVRHTMTMCDFYTVERGVDGERVWEVDPVMGAKVLTGAEAHNARRYFALLRGVATPNDLYREITANGRQQLDGREHATLRMTPAEGKPDIWYIDAGTGLVTRVDTVQPGPEGDEVAAELRFGDWRKVDGRLLPHRREVRMERVVVTFVCDRTEVGAKLAPAQFTPPAAVAKAATRPAAKDLGSKPEYEVIDCRPQPVASIRVKCKPTELFAEFAVAVPEVMSHLHATGVKMAGVPFARHHGPVGEEVDVEFGIPVAKPVTPKGRVQNVELPAGPTAMVWHVGPYEGLGQSHEALRAWIAGQKLKSRGAPWELYWTDPGLVPDPAKWRTQVFLPVEK